LSDSIRVNVASLRDKVWARQGWTESYENQFPLHLSRLERGRVEAAERERVGPGIVTVRVIDANATLRPKVPKPAQQISKILDPFWTKIPH
jgi:hypothetical protein